MKNSILIICLIIIYVRLFLPGIHVANDLHLLQQSEMASQLSYPYAWESGGSVGLGEYAVPFLWSWFPNTLSGIFAFFNIPYSVKLIVLPLLPILILGFIGIKKLLEYCGVMNLGQYIGILFYLSNTYILLLIDGGQLNLALTYAVLPLSFYLYRVYVDRHGLKDLSNFCLSLILISVFDIRIIYLIVLLIIADFVFELVIFRKKIIEVFKKYFLLGLYTSISLLGFHLYWILPALLSKQLDLPATYGRSAQVDFLSFATISHALFFIQPHWYKNVFGEVVSIKWYFVLIPILVFLAPIFKRKNRWVAFYTLIALISIFLAKGSTKPFPYLYSWLFANIPGFTLFRDPTKFYFLEAIAYSVLLGVSIDRISKSKLVVVKRKIFNNLLFPLLALSFLWLIKPTFLGQMTGMFNQPIFEKDYSTLGKILQQDKSFGRVFWIPNQQPLSFADSIHPTVEASRLSQLRPFASGIKGSYETFNFLREAPYIGEIFDVAGIGYIAYPFLDPRRDNLHPDNIKYYYTFLNQLSERTWLSRVNSPVPLLKTRQHQDRFFVTPNTWWVIGSDSIYNEATKSAKQKLSKNALIFVEEYPGLGKRIDECPEAKIVLNNKTNLDLAASFIDISHLIFPAKNLDFQSNKSGWWKREAADLVWWRSFLQDKYKIDNQDFDLGGGWAVGEGEKKLTINNLQFTKGKVLLARVMESSRSGTLKFYQSNQIIGEISTKVKGDTNVRWFKIGELQKNEELKIISKGNINVINALAVLDKSEFQDYQDKVKGLQGRIVSFDDKNVQNTLQPAVRYEQINPTKYKVNISNLTQPAFLIFSQNYDGLWKINGYSSLPVYSLLNGFRIEKNGEYIVEFEPQKYIIPGLVVTTITCLSLIFILIFATNKSKSKL